MQWFICRSITSTHKLKLIAQDLKTIQEVTIAQAKQVRLDRQVAQKSKTIKVIECQVFYSKRKEKKEKQTQKKARYNEISCWRNTMCRNIFQL